MNVGKVLNRLIQVFLVFNILLLIANGIKITTSYVLSEERIANITSILKERNIQIDVVLPKKFMPKLKGAVFVEEMSLQLREQIVKALISPKLEEIVVSTDNNTYGKKSNRVYTKDGITLTFAGENIAYSNTNIAGYEPVDQSVAKKMCKSFMNQLALSNIFDHAYIQDVSTPSETKLIYYPKFENIPVFDSYIEFTVTKNGIARANMHMAYIKGIQSIETKYTIYPIDSVLFSLGDHIDLDKHIDLKNTVRITDIVLGYHSVNTEGMDILQHEIIPTYKIIIEGLNKPVFVNAYTNKEVK